MGGCRILCLQAHPDDTELLVAGTLALLAARGHAVTIATMTPGDCGSDTEPPDAIAAIRRSEAAAAAALIGAEYVCLEFRDFAIFEDDASRRRVTAFLRQVQPDLVITASPVDYLVDHEVTSRLVRDACFGAPVRNYDTSAWGAAGPLARIPHLYFADPIGGVDREGQLVLPDFVVDISSTFDTKRRMLAQHRSQREWLRKQHGVDEYLEMMERWTRARGGLVGIEFGEGFRQYRGHPYPQSPLLEELLGDQLVLRVHRERTLGAA